MTDDTELMAALFVSDDGEIASFVEDVTPEDDWVDRMDGTSAVRFYRLSVPEAVAAGILRLIRERDEAVAAQARCKEALNATAEAGRTAVERTTRERDQARRIAELHAPMQAFVELPWRDNR